MSIVKTVEPEARQSGRGEFKRSDEVRFNLVLMLIAAFAAIPRLSLASSQFIEYDGYWHVFIAQQDKWKNFWSDIHANAHPPLYFLLLRFVLHFGHSLLIYRSVSLIAGVLSVIVVGWIARAVTGSTRWAYLSALAFGFAMPSIIVSCEVRSYMLSVFFILVSYLFLLYLFTEYKTNEARLRMGFAGGAILACLSHYFAFFYACSAVVLLLARFAYLKYKGEPISWKVEAATVVPVLGAVYALFSTHAGSYSRILPHLLPYYHGGAKETLSVFLLRNWENFIDLFAPYPVFNSTAALGVLAAGLLGGIVLLGLLLRVADARAIRAVVTLMMTAIMLGGIVAAAAAGKYPFGGELRQQYLVFPFLVVCAAVTAERLTAILPRSTDIYLTIALVIAITAVSAIRFNQFPKFSGKIGESQMRTFDSLQPAPEAVYLDQFNLILFFIFHDQWQWSLVTPQPVAGIDVYRLRAGGRNMLVFRDRTEWNANPNDASVYDEISAGLRAEKIGSVSAFTSNQAPPSFSDLSKEQRTILTRASAYGLCVQKFTLKNDGWYVTFRRLDDCATARVP